MSPGKLVAGWIAALLLACTAGAGAQSGPPSEIYEIDREDLRRSGWTDLPEVWRFHPGDEAGFADPGLDDRGWRRLSTRLRDAVPEDWDGIGWFRLRLWVAPELIDVPIGLKVTQSGASKIYLDGELVASYGLLGETARDTVAETPLESRLLTFDRPGEHVLAVRYANPVPEEFRRVGWASGFSLLLGYGNELVRGDVERARRSSGQLWFFTGIFLSFALLHFLLFLFYPETRENLYFALLCVSTTLLVYFLLQKEVMRDPRFVLTSEPVMNVAGLGLAVFTLRFVYGVFSPRVPRRYYVLAALTAALAVWAWLRPAATLFLVFLVMLAASLEMIRAVGVALWRRQEGAFLVGSGILVMGLGFAVGLLANLGIVPFGGAHATFAILVPFSSVVVLLVTMSIYLSHRFAETTRELERKLREVEKLSEEKLERQLLEAEYERKLRELEEARELQLSMLPKRVPTLPGLVIATYMSTATEVGGDYYDFALADDGTLTLAIGDATGHGMRAGTMVTATKSLFNALAQGSNLRDTLSRSASALKRLNLRKLAMALTLAQYKDGRLRLAAAGMPPAYVYRAARREVESVQIAGMPLGCLPSFPYRESTIELETGDVVLMMSDGFPERRNGDAELLGYERAQEAFASSAVGAPGEIIERLVETAETWAAGHAADDDMTFVVLRKE